MEIYLDNSATTKPCKAAVDKIMYVSENVYGNPSSLHKPGIEAEKEITAARKAVAEILGADHNEIIFTSGGTEANNTAVFGAALARQKTGSRIVTTAVEHSSVYESCLELKNRGFDVVFLEPQSDGNISEEQLCNAIDRNTILVSVMMVNNETGVRLPVDRIAKIIKKNNAPALFHCDAVQAFGKIPVRPSKIGADLVSVSSHKIHGPKGAGALYIKKGTYIKPLLYGGEQQRKIRPGTEAVPLICGFGAAAENIGSMSENMNRIKELRDYTVDRLSSIDCVEINSPLDALPYILNISAVGVRSETMLHFLEGNGIYVSSGSACAKGKKSHVLTAMGLDSSRIDSALRISFSKYSRKSEIDALAECLREGIDTLVHSK